LPNRAGIKSQAGSAADPSPNPAKGGKGDKPDDYGKQGCGNMLLCFHFSWPDFDDDSEKKLCITVG